MENTEAADPKTTIILILFSKKMKRLLLHVHRSDLYRLMKEAI